MTAEPVPMKPPREYHLGRFQISQSVLADALMLPHETIIRSVAVDGASGDIHFVVDSPDLPAVKEGQPPTRLSPAILFTWGNEAEREEAA